MGRILDGHGDLRPEHICLREKPIIVDRLEFSQRLRSLDPLDEISYLDLECEFLGNRDVGPFFLEIYQKITKDLYSSELYRFYKIQHALIRAKLCLSHIEDKHVRVRKKWIEKSQKYLRLAWTYLNKDQGRIPGAQRENPLHPFS